MCDVCCSAGSDAFKCCRACLPLPSVLQRLCSTGHGLSPASCPSALPLELLRTLHKMELWLWLLQLGLLVLALLPWLQIVTLLLAQLRSADPAQ